MSQMEMIKLAQKCNGDTRKMKQAMQGYCIAVLWSAFEEDLGMGEQAALAAVCETIGIPHDKAYDLIAVAKECELFEEE